MLIRWREAVSTRIIRTSAMSVRAHTGMGLRIRLRPSAANDAKHGGYAPPGAGQAERPQLPLFVGNRPVGETALYIGPT